MIYVLEDNDDRIRQFRAAAAEVAPEMRVIVWRSAHTMIADLIDGLEHAKVISLDHDLNPQPGDTEDPGTGYDLAKMLAELIPCCLIIIHTSNMERGQWMEGALHSAGWRHERVYPTSDQWIDRQWKPLVRRLLKQ
jgi:hypothetical protein